LFAKKNATKQLILRHRELRAIARPQRAGLSSSNMTLASGEQLVHKKNLVKTDINIIVKH
jgi:hypothetical protein